MAASRRSTRSGDRSP